MPYEVIVGTVGSVNEIRVFGVELGRQDRDCEKKLRLQEVAPTDAADVSMSMSVSASASARVSERV